MRFARRTLFVFLLIAALSATQVAMVAQGTENAGQDHQGFPDVTRIEVGLEPGDQGEGVDALQSYLEVLGFLDSHAASRGTFDAATTDAVLSFQDYYNLSASGVIDEPTHRLIQSPRYDSLPDVAANGAVSDGYSAIRAWPRPDLTYAFNKYTPDLSQAAQRTAFQEALNTWAAVTPLTFTEVGSISAADIVVSFESGDHGDPCVPASQCEFDGPSGVLAHAFYPPPNGGSIAGDAHFDEAETWTVTIPIPSGGIDLKTVAIHEFGHSLGLGHSNVTGAIMYAYYSGAAHTLHPDDVAGIQALYGAGGGGGETIDAEVTAASASPASLEQNSGNVAITATVRNNGTSTTTIPVNVTGPGGWTDSTSVSLASGASTPVQFSWPASITGTHSFTVSTNLTGDENGANNSWTTNTVTVTSPAPPTTDLFVQGISVSATPSGGGHQLDATVTVGPNATAASGASVTGFWYFPNRSYQFVTLTANASGQISPQITTTQTGVHYFYVYRITKPGYVYKSSQNVVNSGSVNVSGGSPPVTVDASVNQVTANPTSLVLNSGNVSIVATIGNNGSSAATIPVSISGPGGYSGSQNVSVASGATQQVTFTWPASIAGSHVFTVTTSLAGDTNASNNQRNSPTVTVTQSGTVDAEVVSLTRSTGTVAQNGPNVTFTANVRNNGTNSATFNVRLNSSSASVNTTQSVTLGSGASQSVQFQWSPTVAGNHTFTATAELAGDTNAANNSKSTTVNVTASSGAEIYVDHIDATKSTRKWTVSIYVGTSNGASGAGATVTGTLRNAYGQSAGYSGVTNAQGRATIVVNQIGWPSTHTFTVDNIALTGYSYNAALDSDNPKTLPS